MFGYIYKITNKINGKIYIGKHKYDKPEIDESYWCSGSYIMRSINKYGTENFTRELICTCETLEELNEKEKYWISTLNSMDKKIGYNLTRGGTVRSGVRQRAPDLCRILSCTDPLLQFF